MHSYRKLVTKLSREFLSTERRFKATLIDGKKVSDILHTELKEEVDKLLEAGFRPPHLVLAQVGKDPASSTYVKSKTRAAQKVENTKQSVLIELLNNLNDDDSVDGILVELPLPEHIEEKLICNTVSPAKDVDGFHVLNMGRFCLDMNSLGPCTPLGVMELIRRYDIKTFGKNAVVCGRSKNVGMPIAMLMHGDGVRPDGELGGLDATTTICHCYTPREHLNFFTKNADIIVAAAGMPGLLTGEMIKPGCTIIDVGINEIKDPISGESKVVGDCDLESCSEVAGYITPVPGGVGPMTVAMLMKNTVKAAKRILYHEKDESNRFS